MNKYINLFLLTALGALLSGCGQAADQSVLVKNTDSIKIEDSGKTTTTKPVENSILDSETSVSASLNLNSEESAESLKEAGLEAMRKANEAMKAAETEQKNLNSSAHSEVSVKQ